MPILRAFYQGKEIICIMKKKLLVFLLMLSMLVPGSPLDSGAVYAAEAEAESEPLSELETEAGMESAEETVSVTEEITEGGTETTESQESETQAVLWEELANPDGTLPQVSSWVLGNSSENILNGGVIAIWQESVVYFIDEQDHSLKVLTEGGGEIQISRESGSNLNVFEDAIYYVAAGTQIHKIAPQGGVPEVVLEWDNEIRQMYVVNQEVIYFLSGGSLYAYSIGEEEPRLLREDGAIQGFIPTQYGMIYAKGELFDRTLYAEDQVIGSQVSSYYSCDGYLLMTAGGEDRQALIPALFGVAQASSQVTAYSLGSDVPTGEHDADECEICRENALLAGEGALLETFEEEMLASAAITAYAAASTGQKNIIKRARQQHEIEWTPLKDIKGWDGATTFSAGVTYHGIPYGQPVYAQFVPFASDNSAPAVSGLAEFLQAVNNSGSKMYTSTSTFKKLAPYYSSDCSSFVSYAWGINKRETATIPGVATKVTSQSIYSVQLGDVFNAVANHVLLVADIGYASDGSILYIDILEQTPPRTKRTRYGWNGEYTLADLTSRYLDKGFTLYRYPSSGSVNYTHSCAVPIDGDYCSAACKSQIAFNQKDYFVYKKSTVTLSVTNNTGSSVTWKSLDTGIATINNQGVVTGVSKGSARIQASAGGKTTSCTVHVTTANSGIGEFVDRLYLNVLSRAADTAGRNYWVDKLELLEKTGAAVAYEFIFSQEYLSKNTSDSAYIEMLYNTILGRASDAGGKAYWQSYLDQGLSRKYVFAGVVNSTEFANLCGSYGIARGTYYVADISDKYPQTTAYVTRLYKNCLSRNPDWSGLQYWVTQLMVKKDSAGTVAKGFFQSTEFTSKKYDNTTYVKLLYRTLFGREADTAGLNYWVSALNKSTSRTSVLNSFLNSQEFITMCKQYGLTR